MSDAPTQQELIMTPTAPLTTAADVQEAARWILCMVEPQEKWSVLQDRIAEYLTTYAAQVRRSQWQDIATAPKDGDPVLIGWYGPNGWTERRAWWCKTFAPKEGGRGSRGAWTDNAVSSFGYEEVHEYAPTHWQPLPSPPGSPSSQTDTGDST